MRHQTQGPYECQLAAVAMLAGADVAVVRRMALTHAGGRKWSDVLYTDRFWPAVRYALAVLGMSLDTKSSGLQPAGAYSLFPPGGRGQLVVKTLSCHHAVAYETDDRGATLVYDPRESGPLTWKDYRELMSSRGWTMHAIWKAHPAQKGGE
jgi:hypothetical protein